MAHVNENYLKLPGNYLFATIAKKVEAYSKAHPEANIIRLGIGDVTRPLAPAIIDAMHKAVDEMGKAVRLSSTATTRRAASTSIWTKSSSAMAPRPMSPASRKSSATT